MAIFRPTSSKVSVHKVFLCPFHCKPRPPGVSIQSPELENVLQVPGNGAEVDENYDACNGLSAILSVLNLSRAIFCVQNVLLCSLNCKPRSSGVSLASSGV